MKLSFIILNYKTKNHLRLCLENIHKIPLDLEYEIIVVDNASDDGSVEMVRQQFPGVMLIENKANTGHSAGNNMGIKQASGEYIAIVNPDIVLRSAEDFHKLVAYLDQNAKIAMLGPRLLNPDGTVQNSCYRSYSTLTPLYRRTFLGKLPFGKKDIDRHLMVDFKHDEISEVDWLLGACMVVRKKAIEEIGLMNEELFLYFGDYEWCDRARQNGWKVVYYPGTNGIYHYHKRESDSGRFSFLQAFSYITRIHIKDWLTYLKFRRHYAKSSR
ncbi:MAG: glycosyltransferase family 2 protein [Candidatus Kerfeldbacteria bacterium]